MKTRIFLKLLAGCMAICMVLSVGLFGATAEEASAVEAPAAEASASIEPQVAQTDLGQSLSSGLAFRNDGTFTILQLSDIQEDHLPHPAMLRFIQKSIEQVKPDLIGYKQS